MSTLNLFNHHNQLTTPRRQAELLHAWTNPTPHNKTMAKDEINVPIALSAFRDKTKQCDKVTPL